MKRKYLLHGGHVRSKDGDWHYISASRLIRLYNVSADECLIEPHNQELAERSRQSKDFIHLYPRSSGDYSLPKD